jgi:hypothetical protein
MIFCRISSATDPVWIAFASSPKKRIGTIHSGPEKGLPLRMQSQGVQV